MPDLLPSALALGLAAVHVFGGRIRALDAVPRNGWLSFAGGTSVAYVFAHLLPELAHLQKSLSGLDGLAGVTERHIWLITMLGLVVSYGLEMLVNESKQEGGGRASEGVFWFHIGSYGLYNVLIGYLLEWGERGTGVVLYGLAMALHFLVNDAALRADHPERYRAVGRWVLAGSVVAGCVLGFAGDLGEPVLAVFMGLLGGAIILNVLKEELPERQESQFWPFAAGAVAYAVLLLAI